MVRKLFDFEDELICGIDEAGRGPIAGPLVVSGVILKKDIKGLKDSKRVSAKKREELFTQIVKEGNSIYHTVVIDSRNIDRYGLSKSLKVSLEEIKSVLYRDGVKLIFDGNSSFGVKGIFTLIKGDNLLDAISAASILAKVTRDRIMVEYAKKYGDYGFEKHKGYSTKAHLKAVERYGLCDIHRRSFNIPTSSVENDTLPL